MQQPNISLDKTVGVICESCGNNLFIEAMFLRQVSKFIAMTPKDVIMPIPTFVCSKCNHVNDQFNPLKEQLTDSDA